MPTNEELAITVSQNLGGATVRCYDGLPGVHADVTAETITLHPFPSDGSWPFGNGWAAIRFAGRTVYTPRAGEPFPFASGPTPADHSWQVCKADFVTYDGPNPPTADDVRTAITLPTTPAEPCSEDEACWDCSTMGNLVCGPEPTVLSETATVTTVTTVTAEIGDPAVYLRELPTAPTELAFTGSSTAPLTAIAFALLVTGKALRRFAARSAR